MLACRRAGRRLLSTRVPLDCHSNFLLLLAEALVDDRPSPRSAYVQRLSNDASNAHKHPLGWRHAGNVVKVYALMGSRPRCATAHVDLASHEAWCRGPGTHTCLRRLHAQ